VEAWKAGLDRISYTFSACENEGVSQSSGLLTGVTMPYFFFLIRCLFGRLLSLILRLLLYRKQVFHVTSVIILKISHITHSR